LHAVHHFLDKVTLTLKIIHKYTVSMKFINKISGYIQHLRI